MDLIIFHSVDDARLIELILIKMAPLNYCCSFKHLNSKIIIKIEPCLWCINSQILFLVFVNKTKHEV